MQTPTNKERNFKQVWGLQILEADGRQIESVTQHVYHFRHFRFFTLGLSPLHIPNFWLSAKPD